MIKKLLPLISLVIGLGSGGAAALFLAPPAKDSMVTTDGSDSDAEYETELTESSGDTEIVSLPKQFVVPVMINSRVTAMVILTIALDVESGSGDYVRSIEPKLRDSFLEELFGLAALGGFEDDIISRQSMSLVRVALTKRAAEILDQKGVQVLITEMARHDVI